MKPSVVLVTGVSREMGSRVAAQLAADDSIERVIGVDTMPPGPRAIGALGRTEFVRADIRNPLIAKVVNSANVDTVVHMNVRATPRSFGGRNAMKEMNVIGTMQLLAACQKSDTVRRFVLKSTSAVYGASPNDPALFTEDKVPRVPPRSGYGRDAVEVEGYVRRYGRKRPDVSLTILRFANFIGPDSDSALLRYLSLPVVPVVLGYDARLQFVHEDDALAVLGIAIGEDKPGVFNVAGEGVIPIRQAVARAGRVSLEVLPPLMSVAANVTKRMAKIDVSGDQLALIMYGRGMDIERLVNDFGYQPTFTTREAFDDWVARRLTPVVTPALVGGAEQALVGMLPDGDRFAEASS